MGFKGISGAIPANSLGWVYIIVKIFGTTNRETHRLDNQ
jgi:hypothetical protein